MAQIMIAPGKYVQGRGELSRLAEYASIYGNKVLILITESGLKRNQAVLEESFSQSGCQAVYENFNGECSMKDIERIGKIVKENSIQAVIGIGGGKTHDTAKAVAYYENVPVIIVPTIASTDAPCSALSVIYTDEGVFEKYLFLKQNPNLVLVDTDIVAKAPARLLVAGMGDALATYFEARACEASHGTTCAGGTCTQAAMALSRLCYDTLLEKGQMAKAAVDQKCCTKALEKVIEANTLLSGIGFESGGLAGAHAIHNGFTVLEECHSKYHGEKVAFGTLVQLVLEDAPAEEIEEVLHFCISVGLPVTLKELGLSDPKPEQIMAVAKASCAEGESIHNMPFPVEAEDVYSAIWAADQIGQNYMGE